MPLLWLSLAFICGIVIAAAGRISAIAWIILAGSSLLLQVLIGYAQRHGVDIDRWLSRLWHRLPAWVQILRSKIHLPLPGLILLVCFALGGWRYQSGEPQKTPGFITWYNDKYREVIIEGVVIKPPDKFDTYQRLRLKVIGLQRETAPKFSPVEGNILVYASPYGDWRYGDRIQVRGNLKTPPSDSEFSYESYLMRQGVYSLMSYADVKLISRGNGNPLMTGIYSIKSRALAVLFRIFPDPEASLLAGILLGVESSIPEDVYQAFRQTGTAHIIVISGFNITILAGLFSTVFGRLLGRWRGALVSTIVIALYTILVGADAAVVRAAIMGGLSLYACQLGRRQAGLNSLAFVAALMAVFSPHILWDVGFQLSFAATLGLVLYADTFTLIITRLIARVVPSTWVERVAGWVGEYFLFTIAAQLLTLPITVYYFHSLPLISLLANPVILPVQPPVMIVGGIALILGLIWHPMGQVVGYLAWPFIAYTIRSVEWFASIQGSWLPVSDIPLWGIALYYALIFTITFGWGRFAKFRKAIKPGLVFSGLCLITVVVWQTVFTAGDGKLHLTILDVSQGNVSGEAVLIKTPGGRNILINGGPDSRALSQALGRRLSVIQPGLDWLVVAGGSDEQLNALERAVQRHPPDEVLWAGALNFSSASRRVSQTLSTMNLNILLAEPGQILDLGQEAQLQVLAVSSHGGVFLLTWRNFRALLPLGLDLDTVRWLNSTYQQHPVDVFLLANNGHILFNPPMFIEKLNPRLIILSVAAGDKNGLPSAATLQTIRQYSFLRTDQNGWIQVTTDGEQMWVEKGKR